MLGDRILPFSAFAGILSSMANICIIFMVVFSDRVGFVLALIAMMLQFPGYIMGLYRSPNLASLPGLFGNLLTIVAIIVIFRRKRMINSLQEKEMGFLKKQQQFSQYLFEQTATALVNAIDAKDTYSRGHSVRVARYSERIARILGMSEEECDRVYYSGLLHDVGKIGIDDRIINKNGKLTQEEYEIIKQHPMMGNQILSSIDAFPYLSIGAHYHHERYDGMGYPDGLKGEDIPEIARIISVADAYDAMTSNRSYRDAIPQFLVREEIVKGSGTQFDPKIASVMLKIIDSDIEYRLKETKAFEVSEGILVTDHPVKISFTIRRGENVAENERDLSMILFDSFDARIHTDERTARELDFLEYCQIRPDGSYTIGAARKIQADIKTEGKGPVPEDGVKYEIEAVRYKDHLRIKVDDTTKTMDFIIAMPDSSRYAYLGYKGVGYTVSDALTERSETAIGKDHIPRIAEEISYIRDNTGDIPNVQVDGPQTEHSEGFAVGEGLKLSFHTMSLPTSRLIWHCPYIDIYQSDDGKVKGNGYTELAVVRLDGEIMGDGASENNKTFVVKTDGFKGWDEWKKVNRNGMDCVVELERRGDRMITTTENLGVQITNSTNIANPSKEVYAALTGDQCAITGIRISSR